MLAGQTVDTVRRGLGQRDRLVRPHLRVDCGGGLRLERGPRGGGTFVLLQGAPAAGAMG